MSNISQYATRIGVEYRLIEGWVFKPHLTLCPHCKKLHMLDEEFDEYDFVVMIDCDMFARKGTTENIFTDADGIGHHTERQDRRLKVIHSRQPRLINFDFPMWQGGVYRLDRDLRQQLRSHIDERELQQLCTRRFQGVDEAVMHRLVTLANVKPKSFSNKWNCDDFIDEVEDAALIHIRACSWLDDKWLDPKIKRYRDLKKRGLIE